MTTLAAEQRTAPIGAAEASAAGLVGPNAVIQLAAAAQAQLGEAAAEALFTEAGAIEAYRTPPAAMTPEALPARLFQTVLRVLPPEKAEALLSEAGRRTGDYVIAHRIPGLAKALLPRLPRFLAAALLLRAIKASAWTFAGSGRCSVRSGRVPIIEIENNPLATPGCPWHAAAFARLFEGLLHVKAEARCVSRRCGGGGVCRFEILLGDAG